MCFPHGYSFQALLQSCLHSPTTCHGMVARDLSLFSFPTSVKQAHYIDNIMLTCEDLPLLQKTYEALLDHLEKKRWTMLLQKIQGIGTAHSKVLGVV